MCLLNGDEGIILKTDISVEKVVSDELRIEIIIKNLISNAIRYCDVKKAVREVKVKTYRTIDRFIIEITDNGLGIKKEEINRIFEMFFITENSKGSGIGLYIVWETVQKLHGTINATSGSGVGSKFTVSIPLYYATSI